MNMIECTCEQCGVKYLSPAKEVNRKKKKGTHFYCSRSCSGAKSAERLLSIYGGGNKDRLKVWAEAQKNLPPEVLKEKQIRSRLKEFIRRVKGRVNSNIKDPYDIDVDYLYGLWIESKGICPISGAEMELGNPNKPSKYNPYCASLDRIDNTRGYVKGNVRFISTIANYARNSWDDETVIEFARKVVEHNT